MFDIDNDTIEIAYSKLGLTAAQIADCLNVTRGAISGRIKKYGIKKGNIIKDTGIDIEKVIEATNAPRDLAEYAINVFKQKYSIDYDTLYELYITKGLTYEKIGNMYGKSHQYISSLVTNYGINLKTVLYTSNKAFIENKEAICEKYSNNESLFDIAEDFNIDKNKMYNLRRKYIDSRTKRDGYNVHYTEYDKLKELTKLQEINKKAIEMHVELGMTITDIGNELGLSFSTLYDRLEKCGFIDSELYKGRNNLRTIRKDILEDLYMDRMYSISAIASMLDVSKVTVRRAIDEYGMPQRKKPKPSVIDIVTSIRLGVSEDIIKRDFEYSIESFNYYLNNTSGNLEVQERTIEAIDKLLNGESIDAGLKHKIVKIMKKYKVGLYSDID